MLGFFKRKNAKKNMPVDKAADEMFEQMIEGLFVGSQKMCADEKLNSRIIKARYKAEQVLMNDYLHRDTRLFLNALINDNKMYDLYKAVLEGECGICPYDKSQFRTESMNTEGFILVCVDLPEPETEPLCRRIYFVCNGDYEKAMYFTVEKGISGTFLCSRDRDGNHYTYDVEADDLCESGMPDTDRKNEEINKITEIYRSVNDKA